MVTLYFKSQEKTCIYFLKENIKESLFLSILGKRLMSVIISLSLKIKFSILFIYIVFQVNQGEKSSTRLLIDDKIYQWSQVNSFLKNFLKQLYRGVLFIAKIHPF